MHLRTLRSFNVSPDALTSFGGSVKPLTDRCRLILTYEHDHPGRR